MKEQQRIEDEKNAPALEAARKKRQEELAALEQDEEWKAKLKLPEKDTREKTEV